MAGFILVIFCDDNISKFEDATKMNMPEVSERIFLFSLKRYQLPLSLMEVIEQFELGKNDHLFLDCYKTDNLEKINDCLQESDAEILCFIKAGESYDEFYPKYMNTFFLSNKEQCGVVFVPVVAAYNPLPEEFLSLAPGGLYKFDDGFPKTLEGAAVLMDDVKSTGINVSLGSEAFYEVLTRIAKTKGEYGRMNNVTVTKWLSSALCDTKLVSCIIPIYNVEKYLREAIDSVVNQTIGFEKNVQLILVNDGSTDNSGEICREYLERYPENVVYIEQENQGVSRARNVGIVNSIGRYIMFLDGDDTLSLNAMEAIYKFFESHFNEVDIITYKLTLIKNDKVLPDHYRFKYLRHTGVYDLSSYTYATQSSINICIKNYGEANLLFNETLDFHEDQLYILTLLKQKMKLGYVSEATYYYNQNNDNSAVATMRSSHILFEPTIGLWENVFFSFVDSVPRYFQAFFFHDLQWKNKQNCLWPHHYERKEYEFAENRIYRLLSCIEPEVILNHPTLDIFHKHYWLSLRDATDSNFIGKCSYSFYNDGVSLSIKRNGMEIYKCNSFELIVRRFEIQNDELDFIAYTKTPLYNYMDLNAQVIAVVNKEELSYPKTWLAAESYYNCRTQTNNFYAFRFKACVKNIQQLRFYVNVNGHLWPTTCWFSHTVPLDTRNTREFRRNGINIHFEDGTFVFDKCSINNIQCLLADKVLNNICRSIDTLRRFTHIWLYFDIAHVGPDNGLYQFLHDRDIEDGVRRYYVCSDPDAFCKQYRLLSEELVKFGSDLHKTLYVLCEKILIAYVDLKSYSPFSVQEEKEIRRFSNFEVIYLQHGILHASAKNNYSYDLCRCHRVVVSSQFEIDNFQTNYAYSQDDLITSGMARYDHIDKTGVPHNRILFAPSWRMYFATQNASGWQVSIDRFISSNYYLNFSEFLASTSLNEMLEKHDMYLDIKLHPIASGLTDAFNGFGERVRVIDTINVEDYKVFITDFSSFVFDFVYLKRAIMYFVPDWEEWRSGTNSYRDLDLPFEDAFGKLAKTPKDALNCLEQILINSCVPEQIYAERMASFFLQGDNHCKRLYQALTT